MDKSGIIVGFIIGTIFGGAMVAVGRGILAYFGIYV